MISVAFFNNKGGVGKTTLAYHLAWMFADLGVKVVAVDLDPQANLTSMFLDEERLEALWPNGKHSETILGSLDPIIKGTGDIAPPHIEEVGDNLALIPGDLGLSRFEDGLSAAWPNCHERHESAFRKISAFSRMSRAAAEATGSALIVMDVGPNLGAINRSALIGADHVVTPLGPDMFSLQGLRNLGPALAEWRQGWAERITKNPEPNELQLPDGRMAPLGYILMRHSVRLDRPVKAFGRWIACIPAEYHGAVLGEEASHSLNIDSDPYCLAQMKDYRSLMPMAMEANKPMFHLKPADGAIGGHQSSVTECYREFNKLARKLAKRIGLNIPSD